MEEEGTEMKEKRQGKKEISWEGAEQWQTQCYYRR